MIVVFSMSLVATGIWLQAWLRSIFEKTILPCSWCVKFQCMVVCTCLEWSVHLWYSNRRGNVIFHLFWVRYEVEMPIDSLMAGRYLVLGAGRVSPLLPLIGLVQVCEGARGGPNVVQCIMSHCFSSKYSWSRQIWV